MLIDLSSTSTRVSESAFLLRLLWSARLALEGFDEIEVAEVLLAGGLFVAGVSFFGGEGLV